MNVQANSLFTGDLLFTLAQNYHSISLFRTDDYQKLCYRSDCLSLKDSVLGNPLDSQ